MSKRDKSGFRFNGNDLMSLPNKPNKNPLGAILSEARRKSMRASKCVTIRMGHGAQVEQPTVDPLARGKLLLGF